MSDEFEWDVFLSHAGADKPRVKRLAERLREAGFKVWFDQASIDGGDDIVSAIERGLEKSRVLILCMTKAAFDSEWVRVERNTVLFRNPSNTDRRFLPLLFDDCQIPALIRRVAYLDWRNESADVWENLQAALKPGAAPLPEVPRDQWNPFDPYVPALGSSFFGRVEELRRLQQAMETGHSVSVVGDWRIGKTSLLAAFTERARASGRVVRSLTGEGPEGASLAAFVREVTGMAQHSGASLREAGQADVAERRATVNDIPADEAADRLSEWATANTRHGLRPVLIVDEVEAIIEKFSHRFFERQRGMMDRLTIVLCSRRELDLVYEALDRTSPFYNRLQLTRVSLLDSEAVEELLQQGNGLLQAVDVSLVHEWAGRHPYFVQLLAGELADARASDGSIQAALDRFYDTSGARLRELWAALSDRDRDELKKAGAGSPTTRRLLRLRGLVQDKGKPFGRILTEWLKDEQP